jgi:hypothetical protein
MEFLYLNDIWIVGKNVSSIARLKKELSKRFAMKDFGPAKCILGMGEGTEYPTNCTYLRRRIIRKYFASSR